MKFALILIICIIYKVVAFPLPDDDDPDRIIFPDDEDDKFKIPITSLDRKSRQLLLLNDTNILRADNMTKEYLFNEEADVKFENGKHFQGDMILLPEQMNSINSTDNDDDDKDDDEDEEFPSRTGLISKYYRWPKNTWGQVLVPYEINDDYSYSDLQQILLAMSDIETFTCVVFTSRNYERDYILIYSGEGCSSNVGKVGGRQLVSLQKNVCTSRGTILHELIHALGYEHMHNHADRNRYVDIYWNNITPSVIDNFYRVNSKYYSNFGTPYDYYSVMHYDSAAFSNNGYRTIVPKDRRYMDIIGQRCGMSLGDVTRINNMYNCY